MGATDALFIDANNPYGLNPNDPRGQDDILASSGDLHLPIGKPIKMLLRSIDVLHDFYVPEFRAKMDLVPGIVTYFWFTPTKTGEFEICAPRSAASDIRKCARRSSSNWKMNSRPGSRRSRPSRNREGARRLTTAVPRPNERGAIDDVTGGKQGERRSDQ